MRTLTILLPVFVSACLFPDEPEPPALVGSFAVVGQLEANTCGQAAMPMPATFEVEAELAGFAGGHATFRWESQNTTVSGNATSTGVYRFTTLRQTPIFDPDPFYETAGCTLEERSEVVITVTPVPRAADAGVEAIVDADAGVGSEAMTFEGTYTVDIYPTAGSNCTPLLGVNGGSFQAIPCQSSSSLSGTRVR